MIDALHVEAIDGLVAMAVVLSDGRGLNSLPLADEAYGVALGDGHGCLLFVVCYLLLVE